MVREWIHKGKYHKARMYDDNLQGLGFHFRKIRIDQLLALQWGTSNGKSHREES